MMIGNVIRNKLIFALFICCTSMLISCSTVTKQERMTPKLTPATTAVKNHPGSVAVMVTGETRGIHQENFKNALVESILASGIFSNMDNSVNAPYLLEVKFNQISHPLFGLSFTIAIQTTWTLFLNSERKVLMKEVIDSSYTGGAEGGFFGANRFRAAQEGSARENIRLGLEKLIRLELDNAE